MSALAPVGVDAHGDAALSSDLEHTVDEVPALHRAMYRSVPSEYQENSDNYDRYVDRREDGMMLADRSIEPRQPGSRLTRAGFDARPGSCGMVRCRTSGSSWTRRMAAAWRASIRDGLRG